MKEELEFIGNQLDIALEYGLEVEVIYYALKAMKEDPKLSPSEAFILGVIEWVR